MVSDNNPENEPGLVTVFSLAGGGTEEMEVLTVRQLLEAYSRLVVASESGTDL